MVLGHVVIVEVRIWSETNHAKSLEVNDQHQQAVYGAIDATEEQVESTLQADQVVLQVAVLLYQQNGQNAVQVDQNSPK